MASDQPIMTLADGFCLVGKTNHKTRGVLMAEFSKPAWSLQGQRLGLDGVGGGGQWRAGEQIWHSGYQTLSKTEPKG